MKQFATFGTLSLALVLGAGACENVKDPRDVVPVDFQFGVHRLQTEPAFLVTKPGDRIVVRGYLDTPCSPYDATATATGTGASLVIMVTGRATQNCPSDAVGSVGYQAVVHDAARRFTDVRVVHEWRDAVWPGRTVWHVALRE